MHGLRPEQGYFFIHSTMPLNASATPPKTVAFIDGQNLFNAAKKAFGYHYPNYDVALVFSQDQDLSEVADEIRQIAKEQNRWIKIASAYPKNTSQKHLNRVINKTDWIPFEKALYDTCLDPRDYRPKP